MPDADMVRKTKIVIIRSFTARYNDNFRRSWEGDAFAWPSPPLQNTLGTW